MEIHLVAGILDEGRPTTRPQAEHPLGTTTGGGHGFHLDIIFPASIMFVMISGHSLDRSGMWRAKEPPVSYATTRPTSITVSPTQPMQPPNVPLTDAPFSQTTVQSRSLDQQAETA